MSCFHNVSILNQIDVKLSIEDRNDEDQIKAELLTQIQSCFTLQYGFFSHDSRQLDHGPYISIYTIHKIRRLLFLKISNYTHKTMIGENDVIVHNRCRRIIYRVVGRIFIPDNTI